MTAARQICCPGLAGGLLATTIALSSGLSLSVLPTACVAAEPAASTSLWRYPMPPRIVAVGDVHGAYDELVQLLRATAIIDEHLNWSGGDTHLVSLGDLLDRGPGSRAVMDLLMRLSDEARATGGRVHVVLGNHELMNMIGDLRYVSNEEYAAFADDEPAGARERAWARYSARTDDPALTGAALRTAFDERYPPGYFGHRAAFAPNGRYGRWIVSLPAMVVVGDTLFVHGGLPETVAGATIDAVNARIGEDLVEYHALWRELVDIGVLAEDDAGSAPDTARDALTPIDPSACVEERRAACEQARDAADDPDPDTVAKLEAFLALSDAPLLGADGPMWHRGAVRCRALFEAPTLAALMNGMDVDRVVVGHTPTRDRRVRSLHDGRLIMLDTGMLVSHYRGRPAALRIVNDDVTVRYLSSDDWVAPVALERPAEHGPGEPTLLTALAEGEVVSVDRSSAGDAAVVQLTHAGTTYTARHIASNRRGTDRRALAAWRLDRALAFELVPPSVAREVAGRAGTLQLVERGAISENQRLAQGRGFGGWCPMERQFDLMRVFDLLIANERRTRDDLYYRTPGWLVGLSGNGRSFGTATRLPRGLDPSLVYLATPVAQALAGLAGDDVDALLGDLLSARERSALLKRRDALLERLGGPAR